MMAGEETDFAELDNEPDIGEPAGDAVAGSSNQTPASVLDEDIDIKFVDEKAAEGTDDEKPARETTGSSVVSRERRLKREARARGDALEAEVQRLNAENAALRQKSTSTDGGADDIDREIEAKTEQFKKVRAEFDPEKSGEEAKLIREIAALEYRKQRKADGARAGNGAGGSGAGGQQPPRVNPKVQAWMDKNDWFNNPDFERETRRARSIDAALHADGYRVEDEDYFEELERRLDKAGIKRPTKRRTNGEAGDSQMKDSPVASGRVDAPTGGKRTVTLTREDLSFMATCGLDPKNKAHLKEFAMNKLAEARRDL